MASVQDIYDEITRIDNAKQGIAEAIEEKGVQVPAGTPIQNFPAKVREIQTGSPDAVLYTPQDLTPEQQEQARENIGAYKKPGTGIPKSDLADGVQTSLEKADAALQPGALTPITELIPAQATPQNQLADKNFVNSSVATNTANYISDNGQPFQSVEDLEAYTGQLTNNDYAFVVGTDSAGNTIYTRYKYNANTQTWAAEYVLNNSSFTAAQWAAISSGITALLVQKLSELPTEVVTYVSQTLTDAQKEQARRNIGAAPEGGSSEVAESALSVLAQDALEAYYIFRRTAGNAKIGNGLGRIAEVRGKSLVWNQLANSIIGGISNGIYISWVDADSAYQFSGTAEATTFCSTSAALPEFIIGHKYYYWHRFLSGQPEGIVFGLLNQQEAGASSDAEHSGIFTSSATGRSLGFRSVAQGTVLDTKVQVRVVDLTIEFGTGHEPSTVEEFETLYAKMYYAYNAGRIINNKTEAVEVYGFNQWDEELRSGYYNASTGVFVENSGYIANKNPIPVFPNTEYYVNASLKIGTFVLNFWDANGNFLASDRGSISLATAQKFTTPANAAYFGFAIISAAEIKCINLSDPSFNGQYEPYKKTTVELNLPTLTGKLNGEGDSVVIAPDGLCSAGTVYDEGIVENGYLTKIVKRIWKVDLGTPSWTRYDNGSAQYFASGLAIDGAKAASANSVVGNLLCEKYTATTASTLAGAISNHGDKLIAITNDARVRIYDSAYASGDAATFKAAMSDVMLNYELATPLVYVLDTPIPMNIEVEAGGTERRLPEDTATVVNAPFYGTVQYPIAIQPKDTISNDSLTALLTALKSAGKIANYTMTWDAATNSYKFTIS